MNIKSYRMAHSCPNCGQKDEVDQWLGARMSCSSWGHDFVCCSDECGKAFAVKHEKLEKTKKGRKELADLWEKLAEESDSRMCGEPYYGYNAEQMLRNRRF